jgi:hypothetical protein
MLIRHGSFDKAQLRRPTLDGRRNLRGVPDRESDLDMRIGPTEGDQMAGKPIAGNGLACLNGQGAPIQAAEFAERELSRFGARQHGPCLCQEDLAGIRQLNAAPDPIEQPGVVPCLQSRYRVARGGLRKVQGARSLRDVLSLGDGHKDAELLEGHVDLSFSVEAGEPHLELLAERDGSRAPRCAAG